MLKLGAPQARLDWLAEVGLSAKKSFYYTSSGVAFLEDSLVGMRKIPTESIDLVFTSPPFALTRKKEYGNEPAERYLAWFLPFCEEIRRILKPAGSFVLDIGGAWIPGVPNESCRTNSPR